MRKKTDILFFLVPIILDGIFIELSYFLSYWLRFHSGGIAVTKGVPPFLPYIAFSGFVIVVWLFIFYLSGLYDTKKNLSAIDEIYDLFKGIIIGVIIVLAPIFFYREFTFSRATIGIACILSAVLLSMGKIIMRGIKIMLYKKGIGVHNTAIVGKGEIVDTLIEKFKQNPVIGYKLVGQITENVESWKGKKVEREKGENCSLSVLGSTDEIPKIVKNNNIDTLILAFPFSTKKIAQTLLACDGLSVDIRFVPDPYELLTSKIGFYQLDGITLLGLKEFPLGYWDKILKRTFDLIFSTLLLAISAPLFLIISIAIKIGSKGPLLYNQKRIGEDGKAFNLIKFRSMITNAEQRTGPVFANNHDKRVTKIGRVLRRSSLDELPQILNVLRGDMSLVGPRPERPEFVEKFKTEIPRYLERHKVKSGITGWAQVNGLRGDTSIKERVKHDLFYIENWSIGFDIKILLQTFFEIIGGKNAY